MFDQDRQRATPLGVLLAALRHSPTRHSGSKRSHAHVTDVAADPAAARAAALAWSAQAGRPLPPHLRLRAPLAPPAPASATARLVSYRASYPIATHAARLTPAQARRLRHKHGRREAAALLGYDPALREAERLDRARRRRRAARLDYQLRQLIPTGLVVTSRGGPFLLPRPGRWVRVESAPVTLPPHG